ncbi:hypothetical protein RFI_06581 [Reticulomyxa filosa]|uniref:Uncharacterized protein n=1 Tax=Reticulomyxa filosa TaxID=46433 RepID=X6NZ37_RETFI|nr:hypothetical protein RFI_06581 [Reticulomyxa filosa]|eukprot:ETO30542.1 hypothetical protein RFI_06581 [Reticulomyxa filosa]
MPTTKNVKRVKKKNPAVATDAANSLKEQESRHPGIGCLYLSDKELNRYGLKAGDGLLDVYPHKYIEKTFIIEEIEFMGKMSAFEPFKTVFQSFEGDKFLFVWDPGQTVQKDCNFFFCYNQQTLQEQQQVVNNKTVSARRAKDYII